MAGESSVGHLAGLLLGLAEICASLAGELFGPWLSEGVGGLIGPYPSAMTGARAARGSPTTTSPAMKLMVGRGEAHQWAGSSQPAQMRRSDRGVPARVAVERDRRPGG